MDTTDRRLRTALLPYQPRLLHDVLDSLDVAVVVLDETSRVLAGNVAATRLLGVRRGRRAGDAPYVSSLVIADEGGVPVEVLDYDAWQARARRGEPLLVRVSRDGAADRWLAGTAVVVGEDTGTPAVVCRYVDVTAARELERRASAAADVAARAEVDLVAAERKVALLEDLVAQLSTGSNPSDPPPIW
jgi:PAS domain-containing protein